MPHPRPTRRRVLVLAGAALAAPALARGAEPTVALNGPAFGTGWRVTLRPGGDLAAVRAAVEAPLARIDALMSPWRPDSAVSAFNLGGPGWREVAPELAAVTAAALRVRETSGGAYDPTVGPIVGRWGFGPILRGDPGGAVEADGSALCKAAPGTTLDLCGIAKGHALDRVVAALLDLGEADFLVDLGGELAARGRHPGGRAWHVAVEDPRPGSSGAVEVLALDGRAVATSGDKVNGYDLGGRRVSHIVDPAAGAPVAGGAASVSVIAADGVTADAWATALAAAGAEGPALARRAGLDALFLFRDGVGQRRVATGRFDAHLA